MNLLTLVQVQILELMCWPEDYGTRATNSSRLGALPNQHTFIGREAMIINDHKSGVGTDDKAWHQVVIELEVTEPYKVGKIEITPRLKAAGKSLSNLLGFDFPVVDIRASTENRANNYGTLFLQELMFYFKEI